MKKTIIGLLFLMALLPWVVIQPKANAAEPPIIIIIISGNDLDVEATMVSGELVFEGYVSERLMETYIQFYNMGTFDQPFEDDVVFTINTNQGDYVIQQTIKGRSYNQLYTLDKEQSILIEGKSITRTVSLISMRVLLTLTIEGLVFLILGYRHRRTWLIFLITNLITQGGLSIALSGALPTNSYILLTYVVLQSAIVFVEWLIMVPTITEGKKLKLMGTIFIANITSMFIGGYLLLSLPI